MEVNNEEKSEIQVNNIPLDELHINHEASKRVIEDESES